MSRIYFSLKRKSKEKTRPQKSLKESSYLKYIFHLLHCIMMTFYQRKKRSAFRCLSLGSRPFLDLQLWPYGFAVANLLKNKFGQYCQSISAKIILIGIFMCTTIVLQSWNFTLCCHFFTNSIWKLELLAGPRLDISIGHLPLILITTSCYEMQKSVSLRHL